MELAESETIRQLSALTQMLDEQVGRCSGRVFSRAGDGFLSEFSSPVMAVQSGSQSQSILRASGEGGIQLRIGIDLADAVVDGKDLLGDGVNIAARVEALAEPGSGGKRLATAACPKLLSAGRHPIDASPFEFFNI